MSIEEKYLKESTVDVKIPSYKMQHSCANCDHFTSFYGEDFICQNPKWVKYYNFKGYNEAGVDLQGSDCGICSEYKYVK